MNRCLIFFVMLFITSCANNDILSDSVYLSSDVKKPQNVTYGTLMKVRSVEIQNNENANLVGALSGTILGGLLGNTLGSGGGCNLATAAGAVIGNVLGCNIEDTINRIPGLELEIIRDDGSTIVLVQKESDTHFSIGQRVVLVNNGENTIVSPR